MHAIHDHYRGYLIDAWGVLHDGHTLYPYALDCLKQLQSQGKFVVILSNATRRHRTMTRELQALDIGPELYQSVLCSGELAWQALRKAKLNGLLPGRYGYYLGPASRRDFLDGLELDWVDDIEQADFILNTGPPEGEPPTTEGSESLLRMAVAADIPMICANPDIIAVRDGKAGICAGALAARYRELGASRIDYFGKPYSPIYAAAWPLFDGLARSEVLAVGDAFVTDIRGARRAGLDSCLIASGIHQHELTPLSERSIRQAAPPDAMPTYASEFFAW